MAALKLEPRTPAAMPTSVLRCTAVLGVQVVPLMFMAVLLLGLPSSVGGAGAVQPGSRAAWDPLILRHCCMEAACELH